MAKHDTKHAFEVHAHTNTVKVWVNDRELVLENGKPHETADPEEIRVLSDHPFVKTADHQKKDGS